MQNEIQGAGSIESVRKSMTRRFMLSLLWIALIGSLGFMTRFSESVTQRKLQSVIDVLEDQGSLVRHIAIVAHGMSFFAADDTKNARLKRELADSIADLDQSQQMMDHAFTTDSGPFGKLDRIRPYIYQDPPNLFGRTTNYLDAAKRLNKEMSFGKNGENSDFLLVTAIGPAEIESLLDSILSQIKQKGAEELETSIHFEYAIFGGLLFSLLVIARYLFAPAISTVYEQASRQRQTRESLEKRNAEIAESKDSLKQHARILRVMLDSINEGVIVTDESAQVVMTNFAAEKLFGAIPKGHSLAKWMMQTTFSSELGRNGQSEAEPPDSWVISGEKYSRSHLVMKNALHSDGLHVSLSARAFVDDECSYKGAIFTFTDLTANIARNREMQDAYFEAETANRAKTDFLANMSHEIRTPISIIIGYIEKMLMTDSRSSDYGQSLRIVTENAKLLKELVDGVLDISKIESGQLEVEILPCRISTAISDVQSILAGRAQEKGLGLSFSIESQVPEEIATDAMRLRQILINVIANAIKFTDRGEVTVRIRMAVASSEAEPRLEFIVTDTGIGITEAGAKRLFFSFAQADSSTARKYGGTGLGLVLSQKLARALGGDLVLASSSFGVGSTFVVSINPGNLAYAKWTSTLDIGQAPSNQMPEEFSETQPIKGLNVMIVDDVREIRELYSYYLERSGATVTIASNGFEAIEKVKLLKPDIILMDIQMPIMDGHNATKKLRESGYDRHVIALTAHAMKEEKERCLTSGFDDYLVKPIQARHLIEILRKLNARDGRVKDNLTRIAEVLPVQKSFFEAIQSRFYENLVGLRSNIRDGVRNRNWSDVRSIAHQIRGTAGALDCQTLSVHAAKIEDAIRRGESDEIIQRCCDEFDYFAENLAAFELHRHVGALS